jgi:hypothetical protein
VTIDGSAPTLLSGGRWHHEQSVDNSAGAVRRVAEVTATRPDGGTNNAAVTARHKGALFIPSPVEVVTHDDDGNETSNAHWTYTWDGENRLILAEEKNILVAVAAGVSMPTITTRQKLEFSYDAQGRRLTKKVYEQRTENGAPGTFVLKQSLVFLYDGWNMIAEIDTTTTVRLIRSYEWGLDVSGTIDGAGDVGGLLVLREHPASSNQSPASSHAPCYDGNGTGQPRDRRRERPLRIRRVWRDDQRGWGRHRGCESDPVQHEVSGWGDWAAVLHAPVLRRGEGKVAIQRPHRRSRRQQSLRDGWERFGEQCRLSRA